MLWLADGRRSCNTEMPQILPKDEVDWQNSLLVVAIFANHSALASSISVAVKNQSHNFRSI